MLTVDPRSVEEYDMDNWQPRIGAAYQLTDKTVLRGGWGLYYMNPNNDTLQTTGFSTYTPLVHSLDDGRTLILESVEQSVSFDLRPVGSSVGANTFAGQNYGWYNPNFVVPYVHQFSFDIQRQLSSNSTLKCCVRGQPDSAPNSTNQRLQQHHARIPQTLQSAGRRRHPNFCNAQVTNPFKGLPEFAGTGFFTANTISRFQANRSVSAVLGHAHRARAQRFKHLVQLAASQLQVRMGRSLTLMANYTLSKMIERWGFNDPVNNVRNRGSTSTTARISSSSTPCTNFRSAKASRLAAA